MAQTVIDQLKAIKVDVEDSDHHSGTASPRYFVLQLLCKITPIRQTRERIGARLLDEPQLSVPGDPVAPLELNDHPIEPLGELCDFIRSFHSDAGIERPLSGYLIHGSCKLHHGPGNSV